MDRKKAFHRNVETCIQAAKDYATRNARRLISGVYGKGELVLIALKGPGIVRGSGLAKSADTWAGPFKILRRYQSGSYQLQELDNTVIKGSVPTSHLKPFYTKEAKGRLEMLQPGDESSEDIHPFQKSGEEDNQKDEEFFPEE